MGDLDAPYYGRDLARVHHRGFGGYADACAGAIADLLAPVRVRDGLVLELGCGSGRLTRHLVGAGHRVIATDASPAMLELARAVVPDAEAIRRLVLPDDPLPAVDAVVSVGHALNYLADRGAVERALAAIAGALRPDGILAIDLCDLRWGEVRRDQPPSGRVGDDWAVITEYSRPSRDRYVRDITSFVRTESGLWRRGFERHENVLVDAAAVSPWLARHGVEASIRPSFGNGSTEDLPDGLVAIVGRRPA